MTMTSIALSSAMLYLCKALKICELFKKIVSFLLIKNRGPELCMTRSEDEWLVQLTIV